MGMIARIRENFEDRPSVKIGPHEISRYMVHVVIVFSSPLLCKVLYMWYSPSL
jgi:hypothetical protein